MRRRSFILAGLAGLALVLPVSAQGPGGPGGGRRLPFATGSVTAVDAAGNTITITPRAGGNSQTINVPASAQVYTQTMVRVSDLKPGDQIRVQGVPTGITASSITAGETPSFFPGGGAGGGFGGPPGGGGFGGPPGGGGAGRGGPGGAGPAQASATGTVKNVAPDATSLTVALSSDAILTVRVTPDAKVSRISKDTLSSIQTGWQVVAAGQSDDNGVLNATTVLAAPAGIQLNMPFGGGRGGGGFGGRGAGGGGRGGGGFGGGGGGFPPPGGGPPPPGGDNQPPPPGPDAPPPSQ